LPIKCSQLWQLSQQREGDHWTDAGNTLQDGRLILPNRRTNQAGLELFIKFGDAVFEPVDMLFDSLAHRFFVSAVTAILFRHQPVDEFAASSHQSLYLLFLF